MDLNSLANLAQISSIPLAIIAILVSIWSFRRNRQRRALTCELNPIESPVEIKGGKALEGEIEILYRDKKVQNLFIIQARLLNSGTLPIRRGDTVIPVTFSFDRGVQLLREPETINRLPSDLNIDWKTGSDDDPSVVNVASLDFDLLNPNDELTVEFVCTGLIKMPHVSGRIEGIRTIELMDGEARKLREAAVVSAYALSLTLIPLLIGIWMIFITYDALIWGLFYTDKSPIRGFAITVLLAIVVSVYWSVHRGQFQFRSVLKWLKYRRAVK